MSYSDEEDGAVTRPIVINPDDVPPARVGTPIPHGPTPAAVVGTVLAVLLLVVGLAFAAWQVGDDAPKPAPTPTLNAVTPVDEEVLQWREMPVPGWDAALDRLWLACEEGQLQACDELAAEAPQKSAYRGFAETCGGRRSPSGERCG
ncbi:hypothetical protein [Buchananella hordeovulneris]|uniref:Uncharacterized protein n=1 Tax=Buchananella hordeovulneris TaxID=52770 RepID=A0A1Q5PUU8_9ACTO|nr:hypothetical protein [Buchananella hordeovulneris]MDO5080248.1 hypothetical protein [Buchananella hordeovulneris]OKL51373.1 hypothetical protein BSZ40_07305 [Buchananella hordeovulneris]RRD44368.1 hypothetical protein EII13_04520 [Buchananella hordeovulneris]